MLAAVRGAAAEANEVTVAPKTRHSSHSDSGSSFDWVTRVRQTA